MPIPTSKEELTALFRQLGAQDASLWAGSQISEGIPQLLRFLFLSQAWSQVIPDGETAWVNEAIERAKKHPDEPYAGLGLALSRCVAKGVALEDLSEIARCVQAQFLFSVGYLLDGPEYTLSELEDVTWGLFQTDENGRPFGPQVAGLHESVLETDPTGREMRPARVDG